MRKLVLLLSAAWLMTAFAGCSEKEMNPVGFNLVDHEGHWQVHQAVIREILADSCIAISTGAGKGFYLLVGSWKEQEARSLLLFEDLPDSLELSLTGAKLILNAYSESNEDSILISAHALQTGWNDSTVTWEYPWGETGGDFETEPIAQGSYAIIKGSQMQLDFTTTGLELVEGWLEGQLNNGLLLKAVDPAGDSLKYFYSTNTPFDPELELTFATSDTSDTTISVDSHRDAFIAQPGEPVAEDLLCVSDGVVHRSWIYFDTSAIPDSAFINHAILSLSISEFNSPLDRMTVGAYLVTEMETLTFSSSYSGTASLNSDKNLMEINVASLAQSWADGTLNAGIMLKIYSEYSDLSRALFYTSTSAPDSTHLPTLTVTYTTPPRGKLTCHTRGDQIP
jgi:hypothetical protein